MNPSEIAVIATVVSILVGGGISYGMTKGVLNGLKERVRNLEQYKYISREEYEGRHSELVDLFRELMKR